MELNQFKASLLDSRKRKKPEDASGVPSMPLDELNQDLLEKVLSRLPPSSFFRLRSVCKRWSSVASSPTFRIACSEVPTREPWFFMVGSDLHRSIVFDTSEANWKNLNYPSLLQHQSHDDFGRPIPVASAGGLVCFRTVSGSLIVCNPVSGACRELPPARSPARDNSPIHAIAMKSSPKDPASYKLVMVLGEYPILTARVYDSARDIWEEDVSVRRPNGSAEYDVSGEEPIYFLSKAGDVVATDMQRSPSKPYSSVMTTENGEEVIYFLSPSGAIVSCHLAKRTFVEYPRLLPLYCEHSIDIVECNEEGILVLVLSEFLESASLRVWKFSKADHSWYHVAAMPPAMSHEFYGKKADINCVGFGDMIFVCVNSTEFNGSFICDLAADEWVELPKCLLDGSAMDLMSAFSFEPRIEARV